MLKKLWFGYAYYKLSNDTPLILRRPLVNNSLYIYCQGSTVKVSVNIFRFSIAVLAGVAQVVGMPSHKLERHGSDSSRAHAQVAGLAYGRPPPIDVAPTSAFLSRTPYSLSLWDQSVNSFKKDLKNVQ